MTVIVRAIPNDRDFICATSNLHETEIKVGHKDYEGGFEIYQQNLSRVIGLNSRRESFVPKVDITTGNKSVTVTFDYSLYASLFELYMFGGWKAVRDVGDALDAEYDKALENDKPVWTEVLCYYRYARFLLGKIVYTNLRIIERKSATVIYTRLQSFSTAIEKAWNDFDFDIKTKESSVRFYARKKVVSNALFPWVKDYVSVRDAVEELRERLADYESRLPLLTTRLPARVGGWNEAMKAAVERLKLDTAATKQEVQALSDHFDLMRPAYFEMINSINPVGILVLNSLKGDFNQSTMEQKIANMIVTLFQERDTIKNEIDPSKSILTPVFAYFNETTTHPSDVKKNWINAQNARELDKGIEAFVAGNAMGTMASASWLPLISEEILHSLVRDDIIQRDSIEYIVYKWYMQAFDEAVVNLNKNKELAEKVLQGIMKIEAGLSLLLLLTPETAPMRVALMKGSERLGAILLCYFIASIPVQLASLDERTQKEFVQYEDNSVGQLAKIGAAIRGREDYLTSLAPTAILVLLGQMPIAAVKQILMGYNYYSDLETLLG